MSTTYPSICADIRDPSFESIQKEEGRERESAHACKRGGCVFVCLCVCA